MSAGEWVSISALLIGMLAWPMALAWLNRRENKHRHNWVRVGYGGAGWSLYRCECGAEEIG